MILREKLFIFEVDENFKFFFGFIKIKKEYYLVKYYLFFLFYFECISFLLLF